MTDQHQSWCSFRRCRLMAAFLFILLSHCSQTPNQATPASQTVELRVVSGADQTGRPGELLPEPVVVQTVGADHSGVNNVLLDARILEGSGHTGSVVGYIAIIAYLPEYGVSIALLENDNIYACHVDIINRLISTVANHMVDN